MKAEVVWLYSLGLQKLYPVQLLESEQATNIVLSQAFLRSSTEGRTVCCKAWLYVEGPD